MAASAQRHGGRWPPDLSHPGQRPDDPLRQRRVGHPVVLYPATNLHQRASGSMTIFLHRQFPPAPNVGPRVPPAFTNAKTQRPNAKTQRRKDAKTEGNSIGENVGIANFSTPHSALRTPHSIRAFSLVEILVTMALLSVIVLGLLAMFHQTQRAFTQSLMQVDVLEAGRAATDVMTREV